MVADAGATDVITLLLAAVLSAFLVGLVRWDAIRRGIIDQPTDRSSHVVPTPRGGGLGLALAFAIVFTLREGARGVTVPAMLAALALFVVGAVGWLDDHGGAKARLRFAVHLVAGLLLLPAVGAADLPFALGPFALAAWVFWTVSAVNVVNFLDGIDGIIAVQGIAFAAFAAVAADAGGVAQAFALALGGACTGFLAWNWNPARIFLGDVGSGMLGVLFVLLGALLVMEGRVSFVAAFAPLIPIFLDGAVTLTRRARRGVRLSEPHREHLYQRLANSDLGHARVALAYGAASVGTGSAAALFPSAGIPVLAFLILGVALAGWFAERRLRSSGPAMLA